jgi:hypothetical protein
MPPCTCKEKEVEKHLDSCDGDCGCDDILNGDYVLERMKAHDEKEGWVEELDEEHLERLFFLLKLTHLAKNPKEHMDEVRKEVDALKSFIRTKKAEWEAKARESERERVREEIEKNWPAMTRSDNEALFEALEVVRTALQANKQP